MPNYKISFEQIRQQPGLSNMLYALERGLNHFNIDYYLIGAVSRDVWMRGLNNISPRRTTGDIDFAVLINDKGLYELLKEYLINKEGFNPYKENGFVLIWKDGTQVDLLPFGAVEDEARMVTIRGTGYTSMHVDGIQEVYDQHLPELELEGSLRFKFCTLPGLVLLKLIAWDDRPEARRDDIKDISDILNHFFTMYSETILNEHYDLFGDDENPGQDARTSLLLVAAQVLGRELKKITQGNIPLWERIERILRDNTESTSTSRMAPIMVEYFNNTVEDNVLVLLAVQAGFKEK